MMAMQTCTNLTHALERYCSISTHRFIKPWIAQTKPQLPHKTIWCSSASHHSATFIFSRKYSTLWKRKSLAWMNFTSGRPLCHCPSSRW